VPSATYRLLEKAMRELKPVVCMYQGHPRAICPIILGHSDGAEKALAFQFGGSGSKGPVRGAWKCLALAEVALRRTAQPVAKLRQGCRSRCQS
jgi:hypothetical protein